MNEPPTPASVRIAYLAILGREPEPAGLAHFLGADTIETVIDEILASAEARHRRAGSPFDHFSARYDATATVIRFARTDLQPVEGRLTNFLGVRIDPEVYPSILMSKAGSVEAPPLPANWHADLSEFAGALHAVEAAGDQFTVVEVGCGWGCWLLNTGVAARSLGKRVRMIGVDGDTKHLAWARNGCLDNGFAETDFSIERFVVGGGRGIALFPRQDEGGDHWGLEAIFSPTAEQVDAARSGSGYDIVSVVTLSDLVSEGRIDLLHIDIQGAEVGFVQECLKDISERVSFMVIGTHSRAIEGDLIRTLSAANWRLEIERPAILGLGEASPQLVVDGVQAWSNMSLNIAT